MRAAATIFIALLGALLGAAVADAATVRVSGATLEVVAEPGEANQLTIATATGGGPFVEIPGFPGERIDRRLLADIAYLVKRFKIHITDGYALGGHAAGGEHPIGLAIDIVPGAGGSWNDVDGLARWAEPRQNRPRSPFRWVGYNGDKNHGRGHHLHLSWRHTATRRGRPARTVWTLAFARRSSSATADLSALSRSSNQRLGRNPSVSSGLAACGLLALASSCERLD